MSEHEFECEVVGEEMADIAGVGVITGFVGQAAISIILAGWVFLLSKVGNLDLTHQEGTIERAVQRKRLWVVSDILMIGNDLQMLLGGSYLVTAFTSIKRLDTYHLHLIFDIVSFVGVSNASALVCWTFCAAKIDNPDAKWKGRLHLTKGKRISLLAPRYRATYLFAGMFIALTAILMTRLSEWEAEAEPGRCYFTHGVTTPSASHPRADMFYVGFTAVWLVLVMFAAVFVGTKLRRFVLILSFLQFPVHLYMTITLRHAQKGHLTNEAGEYTDEDGWDFGQTTAVVLLAVALREVWSKGKEYWQFEREVRKRGLHHAPSKNSEDLSPQRTAEEGGPAFDGRDDTDTGYEQVPLQDMPQGHHSVPEPHRY